MSPVINGQWTPDFDPIPKETPTDINSIMALNLHRAIKTVPHAHPDVLHAAALGGGDIENNTYALHAFHLLNQLTPRASMLMSYFHDRELSHHLADTPIDSPLGQSVRSGVSIPPTSGPIGPQGQQQQMPGDPLGPRGPDPEPTTWAEWAKTQEAKDDAKKHYAPYKPYTWNDAAQGLFDARDYVINAIFGNEIALDKTVGATVGSIVTGHGVHNPLGAPTPLSMSGVVDTRGDPTTDERARQSAWYSAISGLTGMLFTNEGWKNNFHSAEEFPNLMWQKFTHGSNVDEGSGFHQGPLGLPVMDPAVVRPDQGMLQDTVASVLQNGFNSMSHAGRYYVEVYNRYGLSGLADAIGPSVLAAAATDGIGGLLSAAGKETVVGSVLGNSAKATIGSAKSTISAEGSVLRWADGSTYKLSAADLGRLKLGGTAAKQVENLSGIEGIQKASNNIVEAVANKIGPDVMDGLRSLVTPGGKVIGMAKGVFADASSQIKNITEESLLKMLQDELENNPSLVEGLTAEEKQMVKDIMKIQAKRLMNGINKMRSFRAGSSVARGAVFIPKTLVKGAFKIGNLANSRNLFAAAEANNILPAFPDIWNETNDAEKYNSLGRSLSLAVTGQKNTFLSGAIDGIVMMIEPFPMLGRAAAAGRIAEKGMLLSAEDVNKAFVYNQDYRNTLQKIVGLGQNGSEIVRRFPQFSQIIDGILQHNGTVEELNQHIADIVDAHSFTVPLRVPKAGLYTSLKTLKSSENGVARFFSTHLGQMQMAFNEERRVITNREVVMGDNKYVPMIDSWMQVAGTFRPAVRDMIMKELLESAGDEAKCETILKNIMVAGHVDALEKEFAKALGIWKKVRLTTTEIKALRETGKLSPEIEKKFTDYIDKLQPHLDAHKALFDKFTAATHDAINDMVGGRGGPTKGGEMGYDALGNDLKPVTAEGSDSINSAAIFGTQRGSFSLPSIEEYKKSVRAALRGGRSVTGAFKGQKLDGIISEYTAQMQADLESLPDQIAKYKDELQKLEIRRAGIKDAKEPKVKRDVGYFKTRKEARAHLNAEKKSLQADLAKMEAYHTDEIWRKFGLNVPRDKEVVERVVESVDPETGKKTTKVVKSRINANSSVLQAPRRKIRQKDPLTGIVKFVRDPRDGGEYDWLEGLSESEIGRMRNYGWMVPNKGGTTFDNIAQHFDPDIAGNTDHVTDALRKAMDTHNAIKYLQRNGRLPKWAPEGLDQLRLDARDGAEPFYEIAHLTEENANRTVDRLMALRAGPHELANALDEVNHFHSTMPAGQKMPWEMHFQEYAQRIRTLEARLSKYFYGEDVLNPFDSRNAIDQKLFTELDLLLGEEYTGLQGSLMDRHQHFVRIAEHSGTKVPENIVESSIPKEILEARDAAANSYATAKKDVAQQRRKLTLAMKKIQEELNTKSSIYETLQHDPEKIWGNMRASYKGAVYHWFRFGDGVNTTVNHAFKMLALFTPGWALRVSASELGLNAARLGPRNLVAGFFAASMIQRERKALRSVQARIERQGRPLTGVELQDALRGVQRETEAEAAKRVDKKIKTQFEMKFEEPGAEHLRTEIPWNHDLTPSENIPAADYYHGTSTLIPGEGPVSGITNILNWFGHGFYVTDTGHVALSYTKKDLPPLSDHPETLGWDNRRKAARLDFRDLSRPTYSSGRQIRELAQGMSGDEATEYLRGEMHNAYVSGQDGKHLRHLRADRVFRNSTRTFAPVDLEWIKNASPNDLLDFKASIGMGDLPAPTSTVYGFKWNKETPPNFLDLEKPFPAKLRKELVQWCNDTAIAYKDVSEYWRDDLRAITDKIIQGRRPAKEQVVELGEVLRRNKIWLDTPSETEHLYEEFSQIMQRAGYDGFTHIGGTLRGDVKHKVSIFFRPEDLKVTHATNPGTKTIFAPKDMHAGDLQRKVLKDGDLAPHIIMDPNSPEARVVNGTAHDEAIANSEELQRRVANNKKIHSKPDVSRERGARAGEFFVESNIRRNDKRGLAGATDGAGAISTPEQIEANRAFKESSFQELDAVRKFHEFIGHDLFKVGPYGGVGVAHVYRANLGPVSGTYDFETNLINLFGRAVKNGIDRTWIHENWHMLSQYVDKEDIQGFKEELYKARDKHLRHYDIHQVANSIVEHGNKDSDEYKFWSKWQKKYGTEAGTVESDKFHMLAPEMEEMWRNLPMSYLGTDGYRLTNIDEYFAETMYDLYAKQVAPKNPLVQFAHNIMNYVWSGLNKTLGVGTSKAVFHDFMRKRYTKNDWNWGPLYYRSEAEPYGNGILTHRAAGPSSELAKVAQQLKLNEREARKLTTDGVMQSLASRGWKTTRDGASVTANFVRGMIAGLDTSVLQAINREDYIDAATYLVHLHEPWLPDAVNSSHAAPGSDMDIARDKYTFEKDGAAKTIKVKKIKKFRTYDIGESGYYMGWSRQASLIAGDKLIGHPLATAYQRLVRRGLVGQELHDAAVEEAKKIIDALPEAERKSFGRDTAPGTPGTAHYDPDPHTSWAKAAVGGLEGTVRGRGVDGTGLDGLLHEQLLSDMVSGDLQHNTQGFMNRYTVGKKFKDHEIPTKTYGPEAYTGAGRLIPNFFSAGHDKVLRPIVETLARQPVFVVEYMQARERLMQSVRGGVMTEDQANVIAQTEAARNMIKFIHNPMDKTKFEQEMRIVSPFYFAQNQAWRRMGRLLSENPGAFIQYFEAMLGVQNLTSKITQDNGISLFLFPSAAMWGIPITGSLSSLATMDPIAAGQDTQGTVQGGPRTILDLFAPKFGPVITIPAHMILENWGLLGKGKVAQEAELATMGQIGKNTPLWQNFVPNSIARDIFKGAAFYVDYDKFGVNTQLLQAQMEAIKSIVREEMHKHQVYLMKTKHMDLQTASTYTNMWVARRYKENTPAYQSLLDDSKNRALVLWGAKMTMGLGSPVTTGIGNFNPELQKLMDSYAKNPKYGGFPKWLDAFHHNHPDDTIMTDYKSESVFGVRIPESEPVAKALEQHGDFLKAYPRVGWGLLGINMDDNKYYQPANTALLAAGFRRRLMPKEFIHQFMVNLGNSEYWGHIKPAYDQMVKDAEKPNARFTKGDAWAWKQQAMTTYGPHNNPTWYKEYNSQTSQQNTVDALDELQRAIAQPEIKNNPKFKPIIRALTNPKDGFLTVAYPQLMQAKNDAAHGRNGINYADIKNWWENQAIPAALQLHPELKSLITSVFLHMG